ncbi:hypothetical protein [Pedobacter deserti]|uniref:hypothetical protein n=1 Tax=Pedobacter deserti TaxID=2817382 RepID=UPI00210DA2EC|nr:hypothetical protein [Pedobacter sp. SYSU D00382]
MNLNTILSPAIITASASLIVSLITLYQFYRNKRFQEKQFDRSNNRAFTTKLYDLRLEHYPKAFEILDGVYKEKGGTVSIDVIKHAHDELIMWKKGIVSLIISNEARDSYVMLRNLLLKKPANNNQYTPEQTDKFFIAIKEFRRQMRRDIGFMFREEKERRGQNDVVYNKAL